MSTSSRTMTPESFGLPLFFRICLKNGATDALLTCVILLRHTRHGALVNKGDAMANGLTETRACLCQQSIQLAIRRSGQPQVARQIFWSRAPDSCNWANRYACRGLHTRTLIPEPHLNDDYIITMPPSHSSSTTWLSLQPTGTK